MLHATNCCWRRLCGECMRRHDSHGCNTRAISFALEVIGDSWRCVNCKTLNQGWKTMCGLCLQPRCRRDNGNEEEAA